MTEPLNVSVAPAMLLPTQLTSVTLPAEQLCHYIRDDELDRLGEMKSDLVSETCLASVDIFFGSLIPAIDGFSRFGDQQHPANGTDLIAMLMCAAFGLLAVVTGWQWWRRSRRHKGLVAEIRERPKVPVRLAHDNG